MEEIKNYEELINELGGEIKYLKDKIKKYKRKAIRYRYYYLKVKRLLMNNKKNLEEILEDLRDLLSSIFIELEKLNELNKRVYRLEIEVNQLKKALKNKRNYYI